LIFRYAGNAGSLDIDQPTLEFEFGGASSRFAHQKRWRDDEELHTTGLSASSARLFKRAKMKSEELSQEALIGTEQQMMTDLTGNDTDTSMTGVITPAGSVQEPLTPYAVDDSNIFDWPVLPPTPDLIHSGSTSTNPSTFVSPKNMDSEQRLDELKKTDETYTVRRRSLQFDSEHASNLGHNNIFPLDGI
jgi:hypothetical protein